VSRPGSCFCWIVTSLLLGAFSGCAQLLPDDVEEVNSASPLKPVRASVDAMQLDVLFVERPVGDPVLGAQLWSHLDQVSTLQAATVASLRRNGFRFGVAPSDPPRALQAALGLTGEMVSRDDSAEFRVSGRSYARRSGEELSVEAWSAYPECEVTLDRGNETQILTYSNARCVFRVVVQRVQDGWARLEITPEVHHGEMRLRRVPDAHGWSTTSSQVVDPQYDQRLEVELNLGEMVVLGAEGDDQRTLGHHFFRGGSTHSKVQRLLVIRLADMKRIDPIYN
jgi:hypothetical protein